jgi:hypothetical protein
MQSVCLCCIVVCNMFRPFYMTAVLCSGVPRGVWGVQTSPPPEILKALQNRAKLNLIVKTVKNC